MIYESSIIKVTKCDGSIVSEHFTKDRYGAIRRIDPVPLGQYGNSGDYRQNGEHSVDAFSLPQQASETAILSTANVVRAGGNLRADCWCFILLSLELLIIKDAYSPILNNLEKIAIDLSN